MAREALGPEDLVRTIPVAWRVWCALLGAPSAWALHFLAAYGLMEAGCAADWDQSNIIGLNGVAAAVLLATLLTIPALLATGLVAHSLLRRAREETGRSNAATASDAHIGQAGLILSALFLVAVIFETVPVLVLQPCG
jgi:hypothetical protein